ncbi:MAG: FKBP-type peptidyl-prolyl cis-trans isomerase, partial [Lachnospiraceae bacterium]|nr:FKBP-type peptidyl-prolyl cis-trans isomerase [Lachnospiraceae bacterium]
IDGVAFEGGNSNGAGYSVTIGSGSLVDDFEQQLIGHKPGETVTVDVTFPENYGGQDIAGKDANFSVTINSITVTPELTDEFVAENFSEEGLTTAEEYRAYVQNQFYEQHLEAYLTGYILDNSTVKSYPSDYLKKLRGVTKYDDEYMLQYYNQKFSSYGQTREHVWETRGPEITDELSYEKELRQRAEESAKTAMVYQAIFEDADLTIDMDAYFAEMAAESGEDAVTAMKENSGEGYLAQNQMREAVIDYLMSLYR